MKIIGSSKIDDYKKLSIEDAVLRAIDAKPGDSVLFYRKENEDGVCIYRAEGAKITFEADAPSRRHMREAFVRMRTMLFVSTALVAIAMLMTILNFGALGAWKFIMLLIVEILALGGLGAAIFTSEKVDKPYDPQALVTVGGAYTKNRLTGISRVTTDGFVASGNLYVNSLFGANPASVDVMVTLDSGESFKGIVTELRSVPGYSVYRIHIKDDTMSSGKFVVTSTYKYLGKTIVVSSNFEMTATEGKQEFGIKEGAVDAKIEFDGSINDTEFDEAWVAPEKEY